ncbi:MAG: YhjD/YihY/BrkB family envelope integrity protein, partial [Saprospiraceae bacterium]
MKRFRPHIKDRIENLAITTQVINWSKSHSLPGFKKVAIFEVIKFLIQEARRTDLNMRASAMTYHFFLALFPSLIFFFTLTAYLPKDLDFYKTLEQSLLSILPAGAKEYL